MKAGKIWQVYLDLAPESILFEGNKTAAKKFLVDNYGLAAYKRGDIRLGMLIFED